MTESSGRTPPAAVRRRLVRTVAVLGLIATAAAGSRPSAEVQPPAAGEVRVTLLGTGNPRPNVERFGPSILVEAGDVRLVFDAGRGSTQRLFQIGQAAFLRPITRVFLTHLHSDHVVGLPDLWLTGWLFGRAAPLVVTGPPGTAGLTEGLRQAYAFDVKVRAEDEGLPREGGELHGQDRPPGVVFDERGVRVIAFAVDHGPVKPAYGYRIEAAGRSVVLSGDTRESSELAAQARGVDLLVCEVASPEVERRRNQLADAKTVERVLARHIAPEQAGRLFADAKPRLAVYSHIVPSPTTAEDLVPPTRKFYAGPLEVGYDLMMISVGDRLTVGARDVMSDR
jgi:ribonuclease Z